MTRPKSLSHEAPTRYLTLQEVSALLQAPLSSVRGWVYQGRLPATKPGRRPLVAETDLVAFLQAARVVTK